MNKEYSEVFQKNLNTTFVETKKNLNNIKEITNLEINNKNIKSNLSTMGETINEAIEKVNHQLNNLQENLEWSNLTIAFFGETNAGKSTIIETLTKGDGKSIGNGTKDFTKETTETKYNNINILDLPGMEGKEDQYIQEITKGLNKCHLVFYVSSSQKEPEEGTLNKLKSFLSEQTNIYSITNVKGIINNSTVNRPLIPDNIKTVQLRTEEKFKKVFGTHYKGSIVLNAKVAQLALDITPTESDIRKRNKAIKLMGSEDQLYEYSNFNQLAKIINTNEEKKKIINEIAISNTYKYLALNETVVSDLLISKKDLDKQFKAIQNNLEETKQSIENEINSTMSKIVKTTSIETSNLKNELNSLIEEAHNNHWDEYELKEEVKILSEKYKDILSNKYEKSFKELGKRINTYYKQMNEQIKFSNKFGDFKDGFINTEDLLMNLSVDMKEVTKLVLNILGTIALSFGSIPLMVIGVATTLISRVFRWNKYDKKERQNVNIKKAQEKVNKDLIKMKNELNEKLSRKHKEILNQIEKQNLELNKNIGKIKQLSINMDNQIQALNDLKTQVSIDLIELVEEEEIEFAYISFQLKSMFIIGNVFIDKEIYKLKFIESYRNISDFYYKYEKNIKDQFLYLKPNQEFQKRAISQLVEYLKKHYKNNNILGVRKGE